MYTLYILSEVKTEVGEFLSFNFKKMLRGKVVSKRTGRKTLKLKIIKIKKKNQYALKLNFQVR